MSSRGWGHQLRRIRGEVHRALALADAAWQASETARRRKAEVDYPMPGFDGLLFWYTPPWRRPTFLPGEIDDLVNTVGGRTRTNPLLAADRRERPFLDYLIHRGGYSPGAWPDGPPR